MFIFVLNIIVLAGPEFDQLLQMKGPELDQLTLPLHVRTPFCPVDKYKSLTGIF